MKIKFDFKNWSIRKKLIFVFLIVSIVPLIITFFVSQHEIRKYALNGLSYANNETYEQTLSTLEGKMSHIVEVSSMIVINKRIVSILSKNPNEMEIAKQIENFEDINLYTDILESDSQLDNVIYYVKDDFVTTSKNTRFRPLSQIQEQPWAEPLRNAKGKPLWIIFEDKYKFPQSEKYLTLARALWDENDYEKIVGFVLINIDLEQITQTLSNSVPEQLVYMDTQKGDLVTSNDPLKWSEMKIPYRLNNTSDFSEIKLDSGTFYARGDEIGSTNIYVTSVISDHATLSLIYKIRVQMLTIYIIVAIMIVIVIFPFTKSITHRIFLLMNKMSQVRQGRLGKLEVETRTDELGHLISSYNYMINSVEQLMEEQFKIGQEKKEAELKALQSQINPHFLYNTLDMVSWMTQKEDREEIQKVIYALSDYYKLVLSKGEDFVKLEDEVRICSIYMQIQKRRYRDKIKLKIEIDPEARDCLLPKITLQPIVENAIIHGIMEKEEKQGEILIVAKVNQERLLIVIQDDGNGLKKEEDHHASYNGSGYGIKNIDKRLNLFFGEEAKKIKFISKEGEGTSVMIDVPVIR